MSYEIFGSRLKQVRDDRGMTQQELADKVGVSKTSLSSYELGIKKPSFEIVANIAKVCGTSTDWLCGLNETGDNNLDNFGEFLKLFFKVVKSKAVAFSEFNKDENNPFHMSFHSAFFYFEKSLSEMLALYIKGTINEELFNLWCSNEIKKHKNTSIEKETKDLEDAALNQ